MQAPQVSSTDLSGGDSAEFAVIETYPPTRLINPCSVKPNQPLSQPGTGGRFKYSDQSWF